MSSIQELRIEANKVKNETQAGANTCTRIGNLYNGIIDFLGVLDDRTVDPYYYDDTALKEAIARVNQAIADLDSALEGALVIVNQERQRLDDLVNSIDGEITEKVDDMLNDAQWLQEHARGIQEMVNEGEILWKSEWDQNVEAYLQEVGVWARDGDVIKTQWTEVVQSVDSITSTVAEVQEDLAGRPTSTQWTQISQKVNSIEQSVNALLYQGDVTEALQSSINQSIDGKVASLKLDTTYAKIDTEGAKGIIEWMYSALRNETTSEKSFNDLVSAGKSGLLNGISNVHTYVEVVRNGEVLEYVAGSAIEAKVNDAVTGLYNKATSGDAQTTIFSQVKKDTEDIATVVTHATGDYTSASIATKFDKWKAGLVIKTDLDSATAALVATMDEKDNASALVLEQKIDKSSADLITMMGNAVSAVNLWTTLGNAYGQLITKTNYAASGIASSASVDQAKADMFAEIEGATSAVSLKSTLEGAYGTLVTANNISGYTSGFVTESTFNNAMAGVVAKSDYNAATIVAYVNNAGSGVQIAADKIEFYGKTIDLNAEQINFKSGNFQIKNGNTVTFAVDTSGNITLGGSKIYGASEFRFGADNGDGIKFTGDGILRWNNAQNKWMPMYAGRAVRYPRLGDGTVEGSKITVQPDDDCLMVVKRIGTNDINEVNIPRDSFIKGKTLTIRALPGAYFRVTSDSHFILGGGETNEFVLDEGRRAELIKAGASEGETSGYWYVNIIGW